MNAEEAGINACITVGCTLKEPSEKSDISVNFLTYKRWKKEYKGKIQVAIDEKRHFCHFLITEGAQLKNYSYICSDEKRHFCRFLIIR